MQGFFYAVQQIIGNSNNNNTVNISSGGEGDISEYDRELLKVSARLDMRRKNALLSYAYELEKSIKTEDC